MQIHTFLPSKMRRGFTLVEIMVVVVIIGLMAAIAIPTFQKVRASSQDKTVINNARQLHSSSNRYFIEFGATTVDYSVLVGGTTGYIQSLATVANEYYPSVYTVDTPVIVTNVGDARIVTYSP